MSKFGVWGSDFIGGKLSSLQKILKRNILSQIPLTWKSIDPKKIIKRIATIAYDVKGCLRFSTFIFWILPNLITYTYGWLPLEQHHKIEGNKKTCCSEAAFVVLPSNLESSFTFVINWINVKSKLGGLGLVLE